MSAKKPVIHYRVTSPAGDVIEFDSVREVNSVALIFSASWDQTEPSWGISKTSKSDIGKNIGQTGQQSAYFRENYPWVVVTPEIVS